MERYWLAVKREVDEYLALRDPDLLDIEAATVLSARAESDPIWMMIAGPSSSGKTETLRMWGGNHVMHYTGMTENSLVSGFQSTKGEDGKKHEISLLPQLLNKCLVVKDHSEITNMKPEKRDKIESILRDAYDGYVSRHFGNVGTKSFKTKFSILAATTSAHEAIDDGVGRAFGQRHLYFRPVGIGAGDRESFFEHCMAVGKATCGWRDKLNRLVSVWSNQALFPDDFDCDREDLFAMADLAAVARTPIIRDRYRGRIPIMPPEHEHGVRIGKAIYLMMRIVAYLGGAPHRVAKRVARSSILPSTRAHVLETIYTLGSCTRDTICQESNLAGKVAEEHLQELIMLGIVKVSRNKKSHKRQGRPVASYFISEPWREKVDIVFGPKWDDEEQYDWTSADTSVLEDFDLSEQAQSHRVTSMTDSDIFEDDPTLKFA